MGNNKRSQSANTREHKRAQFSGPAQSKGRWKLIIPLIAIAAIAVYLALGGAHNERPTTALKLPSQAAGQSGAADVSIPLADVGSSQAKFFDYTLADQTPVRFFVLKAAEGDYRAAFDACEICAHAKKGYYQEGDHLVCRNCGRKFAINQIGKVSSGCHPISLTLKVEGGNLVIKASELEHGRKYF